MPPKQRKQQLQHPRRSQNRQSDIIAIQEHLIRQEATHDISQILQKLEVAYQENKLSLNKSLLHMVVRLCGLSGLIHKLSKLSSKHQIASFLQELGETDIRGLNMTTKLPIVISFRDKFYNQFHRRLTLFFSHLLSQEFPFFKERSETNFLDDLRQWLTIISKSKVRNIRWAAVQVMQFLIISQLTQYSHFILTKQARKALQFSNDVNLYLRGPLSERIKDIDGKIRQTIHIIIKKTLITMESDIETQAVQELFSFLLTQCSPKITQAGLQTLLFLLNQFNNPKRSLAHFLWHHQKEFEKMSLMPNKSGNLSLRILISLHKVDQSKGVLNPDHISKLFQFYGIQNYITGLKTAIEAFYSSIFVQEENLYKYRNLVMIQIVNLLNIYESKIIKENIMAQFFSYSSIPCEKIIYMDGLFQTIMSGEYNYENEQVQLKDRQMRDWLDITINFAKFVRKNIQKYEKLNNSRYQQTLQSWRRIGMAYNSNLFGNIRQIYHQRIEGKSIYITKYYLQMISLLFLPIESSYEKYIQFLIQKIITLFEIQQDPTVLKGIVEVFYCIKSNSLTVLTDHISQAHTLPNEVIIIKKLSILTKFFYQQYVNKDFAEEIMNCYKNTASKNMKIQFLLGLFTIHQWIIKEILQNQVDQYKIANYKSLQQQIIVFLNSILVGGEMEEVKFACVDTFCKIIGIVSNDYLNEVTSIYYQVSEEQILTIYLFLDKQYGLPRMNQITQDLDITIKMRNLDNNSNNTEKALKIIFEMFQKCINISSMPSSLDIILATFIQQEETFDPDQTILKLNQTVDTSVRYNNHFNSCSRQRFATKYFQKIAEKEIQTSNAGNFRFWKIFQLVLNYNTSNEMKEKIVNKLSDIYLKRKLSSNQQQSSLNKALLFVVSQLDRIQQSSTFQKLPYIQLLLKKFAKKISIDALRRVFAFFNSKFKISVASEQNTKVINSMINFMRKLCKFDDNKRGQQNDDSETEEREGKNNEDEQISERDQIRSIRRGPETRSSRKQNIVRND